MNTRHFTIPVAALAALLALSTPSDVGAQGLDTTTVATETPAVQRLALEAEALAGRDRAGWGTASELFVQAAELSGFGTAEAVENLRKASFLRYYLGDRRGALGLMEEAATQAVASGQILLAAHSYLDGAWIAVAMDRSSSARELGERARLLAGSPHLSEGDRSSILARVGGDSVSLISAR